MVAIIILAIVIGYLLGSVPCAYIAATHPPDIHPLGQTGSDIGAGDRTEEIADDYSQNYDCYHFNPPKPILA